MLLAGFNMEAKWRPNFPVAPVAAAHPGNARGKAKPATALGGIRKTVARVVAGMQRNREEIPRRLAATH